MMSFPKLTTTVPGSPSGSNLSPAAMTVGSPSPFGASSRLAPLRSCKLGGISQGPSQFESSHNVQLKKHRVQYSGLAESLEIDFKASHSKASSLIPQLQKRFQLEAEEIQHHAEEQVSKQLTRVAQVRQEYQLAMREMQRKHVEGQQRRIAGGTLNLEPGSPELQNTLSANASRYPTAPCSPMHRGQNNGSGAAPTSGVHTAELVASTSGAIAPLSGAILAMPSSPGAPRTFANEFSRLEATHEKFLGRMDRNHSRCLDLRSEEVTAWCSAKEALLETLRKHHGVFVEALDTRVHDLHVFYANQHTKLTAKQADTAAREERLKRGLEDMTHSAVAKLQALLVEYLGREVPATEQGLAELNAAHAKHQRTLWAELQGQLEVHEGALRELLPAHNASVADLSNSCSSGLSEHEKAVSICLTDYTAGLHTLQAQYDNAEAQHLANLATIRTEHLRQLQSVREGYLGEVAGLLEEYRARLAELKQQFLLRHDSDFAEA